MEKNFAEKVTIKAGGAFRNFPRFACAHCTYILKVKFKERFLMIHPKNEWSWLPESLFDQTIIARAI